MHVAMCQLHVKVEADISLSSKLRRTFLYLRIERKARPGPLPGSMVDLRFLC
jgi:hypothetical protein